MTPSPRIMRARTRANFTKSSATISPVKPMSRPTMIMAPPPAEISMSNSGTDATARKPAMPTPSEIHTRRICVLRIAIVPASLRYGARRYGAAVMRSFEKTA